MFKLQDLITSDNLFFNLKSGNKKSILKEMAKRICEVENTPDLQEILLERILNREKIESTGIGKGFAIPHCHYEGFSGIKVYVGFPEYPLDFKALDGVLVRVIFMIISDNNNNKNYLKTLSRLMYLMRNPEIRGKLISLTNKEDLLKVIQESDQEIDYNTSLKQITALLELEDEIDVYSREVLFEQGKRKGKEDLKEDSHYIKLQESHDELVKEMDHRLFQIYTQLKQKYNGDIISRLHRNVCGHCNVQLPIHIIKEINRENQIIQCTTCSKILVRA